MNWCDQARSQSAVTVTSHQPPLSVTGLTVHARSLLRGNLHGLRTARLGDERSYRFKASLFRF